MISQTSLKSTQIASIIILVYLLVIGFLIHSKTHDLFEFKYRIDDNCISYPCKIYMRLDKDVGPDKLLIYIGYDSFFVNHQKVKFSIDYKQLEGDVKNISRTKYNCKDYYSLDVLRDFFPHIKNYEPEDKIIRPCGLFPLLYTKRIINRRYCN